MKTKTPTIKMELTEQELDDLWSGLSFFIREGPTSGAEITKREMAKLIKKIRSHIKKVRG